LVKLSSSKKPTNRKPLRVLIVEDSENDTLLLLRELRRGGYEPHYQRVQTADAMEKALASSEWDVIISDYRMPRFSALEALKVFKKSGSDAPFIVISGQVGEEAAVEVMRAGAALGAKTARRLLDQYPQRAADPLEYVLSLADAGLAEMLLSSSMVCPHMGMGQARL
jgi:CheY-like chemotaxis protein